MLTENSYYLNFSVNDREGPIQLKFDPSTEEDIEIINIDHNGNIDQIYVTLINPHTIKHRQETLYLCQESYGTGFVSTEKTQ